MRLLPGLVFLWGERKAALAGLMARALWAVKTVKELKAVKVLEAVKVVKG